MGKYIDADALKMDLYSIIKADYGYTADVLAGLMIADRVIDNVPPPMSLRFGMVSGSA